MSKPSASAAFQETLSLMCAQTFQPAQDTGMGAEGAAPSPPSPLPHTALLTRSPGSFGMGRGVRQCWAHSEIRADGWRGWPGGRDNAGTCPASMRWEEMFPATATALSPAVLREEVRA